MFFFRKTSHSNEDEVNIEMLILRLDHSEYKEDKIDALYQLKERVDENIQGIGKYGINSIITSINDLDDIEDSLFILSKLLNCKHNDEFIDILLKESHNIDFLILNKNKSKENIYKLLKCLSNHSKFTYSFIKSKYAANYVIELINEEKYDFICKIINLDIYFDKQLVFEGIFEQLIVNFLNCKDFEIIKIIIQLINKNHFNQNYFIETEWYKMKEDKSFILIVNALLDNTNNNINYIKDSVYKFYDINQALEKKNYKFLYFLTCQNAKYFSMLQEKFNTETLEDVIPYCCKNDDTKTISQNDECSYIEILSYYLLNRKFLQFNHNDFSYFLISDILENEYEKILNKIKKNSGKFQNIKNLNTDSLYNLYIILAFKCNMSDFNFDIQDFNRNTVLSFLLLAEKNFIEQNCKNIVNIIYDESNDLIFRYYCVLICCINEINIKYNNFYKTKILKELRKNILNNDYFIIDEALNVIVEKIGELILNLNKSRKT